MLQAFIIALREGFEGFLIVAIILSYLNKSKDKWLIPAVYWGIAVSILTSAGIGYILREGVNQSLWEGILGVVTIAMVGSLVYQMWRVGPRLKSDVEQRLFKASSKVSRAAAFLAVFLFSVMMITREGMEMAVMLIQIRQGQFMTGMFLGLVAATLLSIAWLRFSYLINLSRFFKVTSIFLVLFLVQLGIYSFHEFSEAGIFPNSEALHTATEQFSPDGLYGKWFSLLIVLPCILWLVFGWISDRFVTQGKQTVSSS